MNPTQLDLMAKTSKEMFEISRNIFWSGIPVAFLLSLLMIYASGQISSARIGGLIRRLLVAVALIVAMPQISSTLASLDHSLVAACLPPNRLVGLKTNITGLGLLHRLICQPSKPSNPVPGSMFFSQTFPEWASISDSE